MWLMPASTKSTPSSHFITTLSFAILPPQTTADSALPEREPKLLPSAPSCTAPTAGRRSWRKAALAREGRQGEQRPDAVAGAVHYHREPDAAPSPDEVDQGQHD